MSPTPERQSADPPTGDCPDTSRRRRPPQWEAVIPILTQRETKALSSPPAPPSPPGRAPSRLRAPADSWWLVLGAQTQESLLSGTQTQAGRVKKGCPEPPQHPPPRAGPGGRPPSTPGSTSEIGLPRLLSCTRPAMAKATSQANRATQGGKEGQRPPGGPTSSPCPPSSTSPILLPQRQPWLGSQTDTGQVLAPWSGASPEPRYSLWTGDN